jgi:3-oxoacyl-[acyl-carrier protein] reductase
MQKDDQYFTKKTAIVTGGNRGCGKEIVFKLAASGVSVLFNSSSQCEKSVEMAKEVSKEFGVECFYMACNICNEKEIDKMVDFAKEKWGKVDILVNNAGKACQGNIDGEGSYSVEDWDECMDINLKAPFLYIKKVLPMMKQHKYGRIINFTSGTTMAIQTSLSAYIAAKGALNGFTKAVAKEVGSFNITVNCLVPGCIDTDMFNDGVKQISSAYGMDNEEVKKQFLTKHCLEGAVSPKIIAQAVHMLCSELGGSITGSLINVDKGFSIS